MPEQVRCPECNAPLRVPDNLRGKNVKCPKCQTTFIAEMEETEERQGIVREPPPARRSRAMEETEEEEFLEEEEEEVEERPRRRRRGKPRSAAAMDAVSGPATALLVVGVIDVVIALLNIIPPLVMGSTVATLLMGGWVVANNPEKVADMIVSLVMGFIGLFIGPLIIMGALKMKKLSSHSLAVAVSLLAMIPCGNCCILGLPFGIWAYTVLIKPEVKVAFR
jgi:predicted Zn finger-like uncharacterized protein